MSKVARPRLDDPPPPDCRGPADLAIFTVLKELTKLGGEARLRTYPRRLAREIVEELDRKGLLVKEKENG